MFKCSNMKKGIKHGSIVYNRKEKCTVLTTDQIYIDVLELSYKIFEMEKKNQKGSDRLVVALVIA